VLYAISDIHGCLKTFRELVESVIQLKKDDELYLLGDLVDRGPDSKGVIDYCWHLQKMGYQLKYLMGNHEQLMLEALTNNRSESIWLRNGGRETLRSFDAATINNIDPIYFDFLNSMGYYLELNDVILVHAGLNFSNKDPFEDKKAMLWSRHFEVESEKVNNKVIVHGHVPYPLSVIINQSLQKEKEISIDAGCVFKGIKEGMGHLVALELNEKKFFYQPNID